MFEYIKIARIDHWFKNVFMLPGAALALIFTNRPLTEVIWPMIIGVLSVCFIASANYVINEWLDAEFDQYHPTKKNRPSVGSNKLQAKYVYLEYIIFIILGLSLGLLLSIEFNIFLVALLIMGVVYNVKPFRTKEKAYVDVLSESINNPLRFLLGWSAIVTGSLPPSSALLAYWMGSTFLMAVKRYAEYRFIGDPERAALYRMSFKVYTESFAKYVYILDFNILRIFFRLLWHTKLSLQNLQIFLTQIHDKICHNCPQPEALCPIFDIRAYLSISQSVNLAFFSSLRMILSLISFKARKLRLGVPGYPLSA